MNAASCLSGAHDPCAEAREPGRFVFILGAGWPTRWHARTHASITLSFAVCCSTAHFMRAFCTQRHARVVDGRRYGGGTFSVNNRRRWLRRCLLTEWGMQTQLTNFAPGTFKFAHTHTHRIFGGQLLRTIFFNTYMLGLVYRRIATVFLRTLRLLAVAVAVHPRIPSRTMGDNSFGPARSHTTHKYILCYMTNGVLRSWLRARCPSL